MRFMTTAAIWDDTKHPREAAGRFAEKENTRPEAALHLRALPSLTEAINESYPVPQANNLESVSAAVAAVAADVNTPSSVSMALDLHERQASYYLNAAGYLGLVEADSDYESGAAIWRLTALGEEMQRLSDEDRAALVVELAESTPAVAGFRENGVEGAVDAIAERSELSEDTIARRAATASSWAAAIDAHDFARSTTQTTDAARGRFAEAAAAAKIERAEILAARAPKAPSYCGDCFTELPVTGVCGSFVCA
jgi:hypothetical protein